MKPLGLLILLVGFASGYIVESDDPSESITWPSEYHLKGDVTDLFTGLLMPFELWYSAEQNRSRMDYYGGMDRVYYYGETNITGQMYKIFPMTTEDTPNEMICVSEPNEEIQDFLPSVESISYSGEIIYNERTVQVWTEVDKEKGKKKELVLYTYRTDDGVNVPVRLEKKSFNIWTGGLVEHTITNYYGFKVPEAEELTVQEEMACDSASIGRDLKKSLDFYHPDVSYQLNKVFYRYKRHHKREYEDEEHEMRKAIFQRNWRRVLAHNKMNSDFKLEVNQFADRTKDELAYLTATRTSSGATGSVQFPYTEAELKDLASDLPENYDMRLDGVITSVKNQGSCGSCWAFSTSAAVEGALSRINGARNIDLSEQSLVDCAWGFGNMGCMGGMLDRAYKYLLKHGVPSDMQYGPYLSENGYCNMENVSDVYTIKGFAQVPPLSVEGMKVALNKYGPVTVAIYASETMMLYSSGIFYDIGCVGEMINHGVTVVGYGVRDGMLYWIVKNSWGENWGQDGYILMSAANNNCNLLTHAYYPIV